MESKFYLIILVIGVQLVITQAFPQPLFGLGKLYERFLGPSRQVPSLPLPPLVAAQQGLGPRPLGVPGQPPLGLSPAIARPGLGLPPVGIARPGLALPAIARPGLALPPPGIPRPGLALPAIARPGLALPPPGIARPGPALPTLGHPIVGPTGNRIQPVG